MADERVGKVVGTVATLIAILGAVWAAIQFLIPRLRSTFVALSCAVANVVERVSILQKVHCLRLRWAIVFSGPDCILKLAGWRLDEADVKEFAYAQAVLGNIEDAKALNPARAAWAIALARHPSEALDYLHPIKSESTENLVTFNSIVKVKSGFQGEDEVKQWQRTIGLTAPLAETLDAIAKRKKDLQFPKCLDDASKYVRSKPMLVNGWVRVRDKNILKPVNLERLRAIRWLIARSIDCTSLKSVAIRLAVLASLEKKYSPTSNHT